MYERKKKKRKRGERKKNRSTHSKSYADVNGVRSASNNEAH